MHLLNANLLRQEWSYRYGVNFARYKEKVKAYKAGKPIPVISDSEAKALYDEQKRIGIAHDPSHDDLEQINEHLETETSDTSSSEEETPEPLKAPSPPSSRLSKRRKILKEPEKKSSPIKPAVVQETEPTMNSALDQMQKFAEKGTKKTGRRRDTKGVEQTSDVKKDIAVPIMSSPQVVNHDTQLKPRKSKKKRKSEATDA